MKVNFESAGTAAPPESREYGEFTREELAEYLGYDYNSAMITFWLRRHNPARRKARVGSPLYVSGMPRRLFLFRVPDREFTDAIHHWLSKKGVAFRPGACYKNPHATR